MNKVNTKISRFIKDVIDLVRKPVMSILPGQLSFFLLLSIIPIVLIIGIILSSISISISNITEVVNTGLPVNVSKLIIPLLSGKGVDYNIILLIISALLLVSKGTRSIIRVASIIYSTHDKFSLTTLFKSIVLSILLVLLVTFLIIFPVLGERILKALESFKIISNLTNNIIPLFNILKWPFTMFIIFINLKIIYIFSPNKKIPSNSVNKGAIFTAILWVILTAGYSFYITHLTKYNLFYGSASNIIILMLWIYLISYIFVLGMSINANYLKSQN